MTWADVLVTVGDVVHARGDRWAVEHGLLVERHGLTGRTYRDPRLSLLALQRDEVTR